MNKKSVLLTAITASFLFFNINLLYGSSYLNISVYDDSEFFIEFDKLMLNIPGNYAEFDSLTGGEHELKVVKSVSGAAGDVIYSGKIKIPLEQALWCVIDEYGSLNIYKKIPYSKKESLFCVYNGRRKCRGDKNIIIQTGDECSFKVIKDSDFKDLKKSINDRNFEISNIEILKTALDKNVFTSSQVRELLSYFSHESNKLDIAKYAYKSTCDKKNYFKVFDAFTFDSSIDELKEYIEKNK